MTSTAADALGYAAFGAWYDRYRATVLEPALAAADAALDATLREQLGDRDLARIRNTGGRVKSKRRTWRKLQQPRYRGKVTDPDAIPAIIDDLVGLRITCTNLRDIDMVQAALDGLPRRPDEAAGCGSIRRRSATTWPHPKDSGYRGWHVNLGVSGADRRRHRCRSRASCRCARCSRTAGASSPTRTPTARTVRCRRWSRS